MVDVLRYRLILATLPQLNALKKPEVQDQSRDVQGQSRQ